MTLPVLHPVTPAPQLQERLTLGMAQLSPFGLSEQWLLRHCGDAHWRMIAQATGGSMAFRDQDGHPVYAAFCATSLEYGAAPTLGTMAEVQSSLHSIAPHRIGSIHHIQNGQGTLACVRMISCFLRHDGSGSNRKLLRSGLDGLDALPLPPDPLMQLYHRSRILARMARAATIGETLLHYTPTPALDFNAVGLLYFPVLSKIAEMAAPSEPLHQRTVVYLGNVDPGESITTTHRGAQMLLQASARTIAIVETA